MKHIIFLLLIVISFSCKKEDPKPASKTATILIEFSANGSSPIYCKGSCNVTGDNYTTDTATSVSYTINKPVQGDQTLLFSAIGYDQNGYRLVYGIYDLKVTYNGIVLFEKNFPNNNGVGCNIKLPFIQ